MKKIIVTLCSLALSLAGSFGINQLTSNNEALIDSNKQQVNIEQDAEAVEKTEYADKATIETKEKADKKASKQKGATPKTEKADTIDNDTTEVVEERTTVKKDKSASKKQSTVKNNNEKPVTNNNSIAANNSQTKASDYVKDTKPTGNNVYVYKNVDLSNCNSIEEVVEELQENGYQNINMNNVQNISSLEDILSLIGNKKAQGNNNKTPAPTTTPAKPSVTTPTKTEPTKTPSQNTTTPVNNSGSVQGYAEEVLRLVNIERSKAGLSALTTNATLKAAADKRAQETKVSFSHTRPNGNKFSTVLQEYGISYRTAGENIAYGQRSPQEVVNGWMNSPGHRANILNANFGKIGIGVYQSGGVIYWSQLFTN